MAAFSFRVVFEAGHEPRLEEVDPATPPGVYQVSGHDNRPEPNDSGQVAISIVQHDEAGQAIVGASGYLGA